ncbi:hypothetical protein [Levilactobacillus sp. N40-8-2]|uniref:hypothetical protein n=1 Tax=Levilactobacillus muriae TaxID=3238987 RepID=UPI0038B2BDA6
MMIDHRLSPATDRFLTAVGTDSNQSPVLVLDLRPRLNQRVFKLIPRTSLHNQPTFQLIAKKPHPAVTTQVTTKRASFD